MSAIDEIKKRHEAEHPLYLSRLHLDAEQAHQDRGLLLQRIVELEKLRTECSTLMDDYVTSSTHHPDYVLIPTKKFDAIWAASLLAASPSVSEPDGWRPIETAPKDGTLVHLWTTSPPANTPYIFAWWKNDESVPHNDGGYWLDSHNMYPWRPCEVSYWRPILTNPDTDHWVISEQPTSSEPDAGEVERVCRRIVSETRPNMDPDAMTPCPRGQSGFVPKWTMYEPMARAAIAALSPRIDPAKVAEIRGRHEQADPHMFVNAPHGAAVAAHADRAALLAMIGDQTND